MCGRADQCRKTSVVKNNRKNPSWFIFKQLKINIYQLFCSSLLGMSWLCAYLKPSARERKQLSKKSREAVSSAVSFRVRVNFGEVFASRGRETNICHV